MIFRFAYPVPVAAQSFGRYIATVRSYATTNADFDRFQEKRYLEMTKLSPKTENNGRTDEKTLSGGTCKSQY